MRGIVHSDTAMRFRIKTIGLFLFVKARQKPPMPFPSIQTEGA